MMVSFEPEKYGWKPIQSTEDDFPFCLLIGHGASDDGRKWYLMHGVFKDGTERTVAQEIGTTNCFISPTESPND